MQLRTISCQFKIAILFLLFIPQILLGESTHIQLRFDETSDLSTFDDHTIQFFPPVGIFFNDYLPEYGSYNQKAKTVDIAFNMQEPGFVKLNLKGTLYLYVEPGDRIIAKSKIANGTLILNFIGKHSEANNLYNNVLQASYREELTQTIEQKLDQEKSSSSSTFQGISPLQDRLNKQSNAVSYIDTEWAKTVTPFNKLYEDGALSKTGLSYFTTALYLDFFSRPLIHISTNISNNNQNLSPEYKKLLAYIFKKNTNNDLILSCKNASVFLSKYAKFEKLKGNPNSRAAVFDVFKVYQYYGVLTKKQQEFCFAQLFFIQKMLAMDEFNLKDGFETYQKLYPNSPFIPILQSTEKEVYSPITVKKAEHKLSKEIKAEDLAILVRFDKKEMTMDSVSITTLNSLTKDYGNSSPIFIDFWATWCVPCIMEFANIKETEMLLDERGIDAFFISIDKPELRNRWIEIIKNKKLYGTHILASKKLKKELLENYKLNGIPRYMVVDGKNNIVEKDAPRPSDRQNLIKVLNRLRQ